ncbi:ATP-grasp domain-containing protein [Rubrivivax sp. JA1024]|uniref:ATP-grasp domain-containing protein n=1 Tax=Rubrivivax sp. JA1026 TaxID=2710888 RepID=UPI0013E904B3|nr:ATP-grasp domain-containing protein [Rubrivivax sp. JA1026]MCD0418124.1 ATP-grasp domain-containing protein [Rubrivivax sp. JA1024]
MKAGFDLVCIGAGDEQVAGIAAAQRLGLRVFALDGNASAPGLALADAAEVVDLRDADAVVAVVRRTGARGVVPVPLGAVLATVGAVNDALCFRGISSRSARLCTDKALMRAAFAAAGLAQPMSLPAATRDEVLAAARRVGFPLVVKPASGSGSRGVALLADAAELDDFLERHGADLLERFAGGALVESVLRGQEYGVDGVVADGVCSVLSLRRKLMSPPPARVALAYTGPVRLAPDTMQRIDAAMRRATACIGLHDCLFHADVMVSDAGEVTIIELSGRPSGFGLSSVLLPACLGVDVQEQAIRMTLGLSYSFQPTRRRIGRLAGVVDRAGTVRSLGSPERARAVPGVVSLRLALSEGDVVPDMASGADWWHAGHAIVVADDEPALDAAWRELCRALAITIE